MGDRKTLFKAWQIKAGAAPLCGVAFARRHGIPDGDAAFFMGKTGEACRPAAYAQPDRALQKPDTHPWICREQAPARPDAARLRIALPCRASSASHLAACAPHRLPVATASPQSGNDSRNITRPYQPAETTRCRTPPHAAATHARLATGHGNGQGSMRYIDETRLRAGACTLRGSGRTGCHSSLVAC